MAYHAWGSVQRLLDCKPRVFEKRLHAWLTSSAHASTGEHRPFPGSSGLQEFPQFIANPPFRVRVGSGPASRVLPQRDRMWTRLQLANTSAAIPRPHASRIPHTNLAGLCWSSSCVVTVMIQPPTTSIVFIIDDDADVRASIAGLLKSVGLRSETFGTPQEF